MRDLKVTNSGDSRNFLTVTCNTNLSLLNVCVCVQDSFLFHLVTMYNLCLGHVMVIGAVRLERQ